MEKIFGTDIHIDSVTLTSNERYHITNCITKWEEEFDKSNLEFNIGAYDNISTYYTDFVLHTDNNYDCIVKKLNLCLVDYLNTLSFDFTNYVVEMSELWFQIYRDGHGHEKHNHGGAFMSCAYYFHAPENCAKLNFYNPINAGLRNYPTHVDKNYGNDYVTVTPVTDKVVFFPSWLDHGTTVNKTTEPRVVFSANWKWRPK